MSAVKTVVQLAQSAYQAYCKMAIQLDEEGLAGNAQVWDELDPGTQQCWVAVVTQLWAEMTALQIGVPVSVTPAPSGFGLLRNALVDFVGTDNEAELVKMEAHLRMLPMPEVDRAVSINGIHALLATMAAKTS